MQNFISSVFRFVLKVVLTVFGLVIALTVIAVALVVVLLSLLKALLTGRKPAPVAVFGKFQKFAPGGMWPGSAASNASSKPRADVVDVEVREIIEPKDDKKLP